MSLYSSHWCQESLRNNDWIVDGQERDHSITTSNSERRTLKKNAACRKYVDPLIQKSTGIPHTVIKYRNSGTSKK